MNTFEIVGLAIMGLMSGCVALMFYILFFAPRT